MKSFMIYQTAISLITFPPIRLVNYWVLWQYIWETLVPTNCCGLARRCRLLIDPELHNHCKQQIQWIEKLNPRSAFCSLTRTLTQFNSCYQIEIDSSVLCICTVTVHKRIIGLKFNLGPNQKPQTSRYHKPKSVSWLSHWTATPH